MSLLFKIETFFFCCPVITSILFSFVFFLTQYAIGVEPIFYYLAIVAFTLKIPF